MKQSLVNVALKLVNLQWEGCYCRPSSHSRLTGSFDVSQSHLTPQTIQSLHLLGPNNKLGGQRRFALNLKGLPP